MNDTPLEDYSLLVDTIKRVFADVPYLGDENVVGTPEHRTTCGDCEALHSFFFGRRR